MNKLLEARKAKRESQAQAANAIGIAQSMLAMMETGDRNGSDKTKRKVAEHYGKSVGELFFSETITSGDIHISAQREEAVK